MHILRQLAHAHPTAAALAAFGFFVLFVAGLIVRAYRKYRAGDYRIIFTLKENNISVLRIGHRSSVYR